MPLNERAQILLDRNRFKEPLSLDVLEGCDESNNKAEILVFGFK
jgi:hypothetical protein